MQAAPRYVSSYTAAVSDSGRAADTAAREAENRKGWQLSTGLEHRLVGNTFVTAEYRYNDYKNYKATYGSESVSLGFSRHQIVTGIGMRF